jgi:hypothetical protein
VVSVVVHGVAATPVMRRLDRARHVAPAGGIDRGSGAPAPSPG